jgi:hypothetical protein
MACRTRRMIKDSMFLVAALVVTLACERSQTSFAIPTSPSATIPPIVAAPTPPGGAAPTATSISVGQTVRAAVTLSDGACDKYLTEAIDPCLRYAIVPSEAGLLRVQLNSPGPSELALRIGGVVYGYTVERIEHTVRVSAGVTYELSVALHNAKSGNTSQLFELTTSLVP